MMTNLKINVIRDEYGAYYQDDVKYKCTLPNGVEHGARYHCNNDPNDGYTTEDLRIERFSFGKCAFQIDRYHYYSDDQWERKRKTVCRIVNEKIAQNVHMRTKFGNTHNFRLSFSQSPQNSKYNDLNISINRTSKIRKYTNITSDISLIYDKVSKIFKLKHSDLSIHYVKRFTTGNCITVRDKTIVDPIFNNYRFSNPIQAIIHRDFISNENENDLIVSTTKNNAIVLKKIKNKK
jgi:hypothetical protein